MSVVEKVTALLGSWREGGRLAEKQLLEAIYCELSRIASRQLSRERVSHTLEPAALVHEAYLRLLEQRHLHFHNRAQFFALAARMMRRVLIDHERRRACHKRGGEIIRISLDEQRLVAKKDGTRVSALDDALTRLSRLDPRKASIVDLRFFGGMTLAETAKALGCSPRTVAYDWEVAKAWLARELT